MSLLTAPESASNHKVPVGSWLRSLLRSKKNRVNTDSSPVDTSSPRSPSAKSAKDTKTRTRSVRMPNHLKDSRSGNNTLKVKETEKGSKESRRRSASNKSRVSTKSTASNKSTPSTEANTPSTEANTPSTEANTPSTEANTELTKDVHEVLSHMPEIQFEEEFLGYLKDPEIKLVVVLFYSDWCKPCKLAGPKLNAMAITAQEEESKFLFCRIDAENMEDLCDQYDIAYLPTVKLFCKGECVETLVGDSIQSVGDKILAASQL